MYIYVSDHVFCVLFSLFPVQVCEEKSVSVGLRSCLKFYFCETNYFSVILYVSVYE